MLKPRSSHFERFYRNNSFPFLVPFVVFCAVLAWRPFWLGFYHDDWATIASPPDLIEDFRNQISRPFYWITFSLLRYLMPRSPFSWQVLLVLLVTGSSVLIGLLAHRIAILISNDAIVTKWAATISAATWLAFPWTLGVTAWPTTAAAQISIVGICLVAIALISSRSTKIKLIYGLPIFVATSLVNELFWFSFIPLLMIVAAANYVRDKTVRVRELNYLLLTFGAAQLILISLNRFLMWFGMGTNRSFNAAWIDTTWLSLRLLPDEASQAVLWPNIFWGMVTVILAIIFAAMVLHPRRYLVASTSLAIACGVLGSVCLWALASYRVESIGLFSRTTVALSVWLALVPAIVVAVSANLNSTIRGLVLVVVTSMIVLLSASSIVRLQGWVAAWAHEQDVLRSFPEEDINVSATRGSFIVVVAPNPPESIAALTAFWDLTGALRATHPKLSLRIDPNGHSIFATMANLETQRTVWDGRQLMQSWCSTPTIALWTLIAPSDLYVWQYATRTLKHYTVPVSFGCGDPVPGT